MKLITNYFHELTQQASAGWNRFWFAPADPATLCVLRIGAGAMLFYTHLVWLFDSEAFFGSAGWLSSPAITALTRSGASWSIHWFLQTPGLLLAMHLFSLTIFGMFTLGFWTRPVSVLAYLITVSYANRVPAALFGLDQVNAMLAMYLMLGPAGAEYSIDRWLANRHRQIGSASPGSAIVPSVSANIAIRLIQVHLAIVYLFSGISKLQGPAWWNGTALWNAVANLEYQSIDMTWMAHWPLFVNILTHVTVFWEISYCVLVWGRLTRPLVLCLALPLHLGIALCLGMRTFGLAMLLANAAFISPSLIRVAVAGCLRLVSRGATSVPSPSASNPPVSRAA